MSAILDAKYRDIWNKGLPRHMLYQLAIYALSRDDNPEAAILYPVVDERASVEVINVRDVINKRRQASVVLRPVHLSELESLLQEQGSRGAASRSKYAVYMAFGSDN